MEAQLIQPKLAPSQNGRGGGLVEVSMKLLIRFADDESGATAIEYGLIAALIALGIIAAATTLGGSLSDLFLRISGKLDAATVS